MKKIAYLILAHDEEKLLLRLIQSLNYNADFYIHVDKSSDFNFKKFEKFKNVFFVERVDVFWGGFSVVDATLNLINATVESEDDYVKVVLLSGHDYPVRSAKYIYNFLNANKDNFINGFNISDVEIKQIKKEIIHPHFYDIKFFEKNGKIFKIIRKISNIFCKLFFLKSTVKISPQIKSDIYKGSQWWAINSNVIEYFYEYTHNPQKSNNYIKRMKKIFAPDEKFFHTLFFNSQFSKTNQVSGPKKFPTDIYYKYPKGSVIRTTAYMANLKNIHLINPDLRKIYTIEDLNYILKETSSNDEILFIRKVNINESAELLDFLDEKNEEKNDFSCNQHL
ncbi:beta-1,6-N-acetylglucosaminyltransferase [Pediococcus pentosaceus]|jgi:hypothetical protein|uniref:beta-1,6-N-acetylglucosaminyltransferase n=1 Tax=Pediococcus pentosaceus TaxID=1255 RepID=UPI0021E98714|nr:beta-1,6-N-acetylglucosaminyltransferase [Pediococcus pentosaceus]MCV3325606.1 beta-1,6-N-acetylglucosaminyltransferase [Pediococcus pentosaceus]